ncbi:MAG: hypothetical protein ACYC2T_13280 [Bacillota bacterium]
MVEELKQKDIEEAMRSLINGDFLTSEEKDELEGVPNEGVQRQKLVEG